MKILLFANSSWNLYNFRIGLIESLIKKNHEIYFFGKNDNYTKKLLNKNINYVSLSLSKKGKNPLKEIVTIIFFFLKIRKIKPDYILSFTIKPNLYSLLISHFFKTKVIVNITGLGNTFINKNYLTYIIIIFYKLLINKSFYIFFQNKDDLNYFKKLNLLNKVKHGVIPGSGINLNFFEKRKKIKFNKNIKFVFVGRTIKEKGVYEYCEASKYIKDLYNNISFAIIGFGEYKHLYKKYPHIDYIYSDEVNKLDYLNFDCLVLPSYREGLPRVILEFALLGIPSITTNVPGCREIIKDNYNGFLCEPFSVTSLKNSIKNFLKLTLNKKLKMSYNAKKYVEENFNEEIVINKYLKIMHEKK